MRYFFLAIALAGSSVLAAPPTPPQPLPMGEQFTTLTATPLRDGPAASALAVEQRKQENASVWSWAYKIRRFFAN